MTNPMRYRRVRSGREDALDVGAQDFTYDDESWVALQREVAQLSANMSHLMPLVGKADQMNAALHRIDNAVTELRSDVRNLSSNLDVFRREIRDEVSQTRAIFWSRIAAAATAGMLLIMAYQAFGAKLLSAGG